MGDQSKYTNLCLSIGLCFLLCSPPLSGYGQVEETPLVLTQMPFGGPGDTPEKAFHFRSAPPEGSRIVILDRARPDAEVQVLTKDFVAACDPCVSFDGTQLLFAARERPDDQWNIWEMKIDGRDRRRITSNLGDCREPAYLAKSSITPPDFTDKVRWIVFTSTAARTYDESGEEYATALYIQNIEPIEGRGTVIWRTTFNLSHDFSPTVLSDGRVLFSSWQHHGTRYYPYGMIALMTTNWAGTGLNLFYGNHQGKRVKTMACELPDRTVVFVESDGRTSDGSGQLARVSFNRPLRSHRVLSHGTGRYRTPHPFPDGRMTVSYARDDESYGLYFFDEEKGLPGGKIYDDPRWDDVDAAGIVSKDEPQGRITIVVDSKKTGHLQCLNVYDSDRPEAADIQQGEVKRVRFVEGVPLSHTGEPTGSGIHSGQSRSGVAPSGSYSHAGTRILGEAPVESDGSFYVEIVSDTPFFMQTLDHNGMALQTMRGWTWVRRGSRRGCIGCHENKELAPENRTTDALRKAEPQSMTAPPEHRRTVDFKRDVLPVIEHHCMKCHSGPSPKGGLDLGGQRTKYFCTAYENLVMPDTGMSPEHGGTYIHPFHARTSVLIRLLYGWDGKNMPPDRPLTDEERRRVAEWIDLGAPWNTVLMTER